METPAISVEIHDQNNLVPPQQASFFDTVATSYLKDGCLLFFIYFTDTRHWKSSAYFRKRLPDSLLNQHICFQIRHELQQLSDCLFFGESNSCSWVLNWCHNRCGKSKIILKVIILGWHGPYFYCRRGIVWFCLCRTVYLKNIDTMRWFIYWLHVRQVMSISS